MNPSHACSAHSVIAAFRVLAGAVPAMGVARHVIAVVLCAPLLVRCGGGGGGSSQDALVVESLSYGRGLDDGSRLEAVSPLTLVDTNPKTGLALRDTLRALGEGVDVRKLVSVGLGPSFRPVVIPRNGILVIRFSKPLDASSVVGDELDDRGLVVRSGSVQVRLQDGRGVPVQLAVRGALVLIDAAIDGTVGFPASPLVFGVRGEPVPDATGFLRLIVPITGGAVVHSASAHPLAARADALGTSDAPIGLNPGNAKLDFIEQNDLLPSDRTFNGFLPDDAAPRIVRDHVVKGTIDLSAGDTFAPNSLTDVAQTFSARARRGRGEWADALLVLRPGRSDAEQHLVHSNTVVTLVIEDAFRDPPRDGDGYRLERTELFEPQPAAPIDPATFDPDDPQNEANRDLRWFVSFEEIDELGRVRDVDGDGRTMYTPFESVPSRAVARVRFSRPIDVATALPFESFRVTDDPEPESAGFERVGVTFAGPGARVIGYVAKHGSESSAPDYQGFAPSPDGAPSSRQLRLVLRVVPDFGYLREHMSRDQLAVFLEQGYRGLASLGGRSLAFANPDFDPALGYVDYACTFTAHTISGRTYDDVAGIVHLFRGQPASGNDPHTGQPGVHFHDRPEFYGPHLADINLRANGFLSGGAVTFVQKPLDDHNPPPDGQFSPFPFGVPEPLNLVGGGRLQHVYRALDASPNPDDLNGSLLDLRRISWAPIGGNVSADVYDNVAIYAAHSDVIPDSSQTAGVPNNPNSGLDATLDPETPFSFCAAANQKQPNYVAPLQNCVPNGTPYLVRQADLFTPPGDTHAYEPWPEFQRSFAYDNRSSLLVEYRIHPQQRLVSFANGCVFSPAILSSALPNVRMITFGTAAAPLNPDDTTDARQKCGQFGDNSRYFAVFDYVKTTSRIESGFIGVTGTVAPDYLLPVFDPPLASLPSGTELKIEFQGADSAAGLVTGPWTENIDDLDLRWLFVRFRLTLSANPATRLSPTLDSVVIPYRRSRP